jgi:hypothetical protein
MAQVACFCGCCFSFDRGAGACPKCGEVASLSGGAAPEILVRDWPQEPAAVTDEASRNEPPTLTWPELAGVLPAFAMDVIARGR